MLNGRDFMLDDPDFHWNNREFWTVEILMMNEQDFHVEQSRFHYNRSRFSR